MNKKELYRLTPGTWVEVEFNDAENDVALLLEKVEPEAGDISVQLYFPEQMETHSHTVHTQIVRVVGMLKVPKI